MAPSGLKLKEKKNLKRDFQKSLRNLWHSESPLMAHQFHLLTLFSHLRRHFTRPTATAQHNFLSNYQLPSSSVFNSKRRWKLACGNIPSLSQSDCITSLQSFCEIPKKIAYYRWNYYSISLCSFSSTLHFHFDNTPWKARRRRKTLSVANPRAVEYAKKNSRFLRPYKVFLSFFLSSATLLVFVLTISLLSAIFLLLRFYFHLGNKCKML